MRTKTIVVLVAVASTLALTACGLEIVPIPPNQQLPDRTGQYQAPWLLLGGDGDKLELGVMKGTDDCDRFAGVDVIQTNQGVEIRAWIESIRTDVCTLERVIHHTTVSLDEPLSLRPLTGCLLEDSGLYSTRHTCADIVEMRGPAPAAALLRAETPGEHRGSAGEARAVVVAYLEAAAGSKSDRGWSLLLPDSQRAYESREQYIELAAAAAWDKFSWHLAEARSSFCEDGGVYCQVRLQIAGIPPGFLLEAPNSKPTDMLKTITLDHEGGAAWNAWMVVYFDVDGSRGISTGGG